MSHRPTKQRQRKPEEAEAEDTPEGRSDLRAAVENGTLLLTTLWACSSLHGVGHGAEATALGAVALCTVLIRLTALGELPEAWVRSSRSCPDTGLLYGTVCLPLMLASKLAAARGACDRYLSFNLWACMGASACLLLSFAEEGLLRGRVPRLLVAARTAAVAAGVAAAWRACSLPGCGGSEGEGEGEGEDEGFAAAALHAMLVLCLCEGALRLCRTALAHSFSVGEGGLVAQALALALADFAAFSLRPASPLRGALRLLPASLWPAAAAEWPLLIDAGARRPIGVSVGPPIVALLRQGDIV